VAKQSFTLKSNIKQLSRKMRARSAALGQNLGNRALPAIAAEFTRRVRTNQFRPYGGKTSPRKLQTRSGKLKDSVVWSSQRRGWFSKATMQASGPHAKIQEFGGTVSGSPWLSIPLKHTLDASGQVQSQYQIPPGTKRTRGGFPTFIYRGRTGALIIAARSSGQITALRILRSSVTLPPGRFGFFRTWRSMMAFRNRKVKESARAAMRGRVA